MSQSERSSEVVSSLMNKLALASSPGIKSTKLYFSSQNSSGELIQSQTMYGKLSNTLASTAWGSSNQIVIPSTSMISNIYIHFKLKLPSHVFVDSGWAYRLLDNISYIWGSTNTSMISLPRTSILMAVLKQCATAEAQSEYIWEAGNSSYYDDTGAAVDTVRDIEGTVMIPLPWSVSCSELKPPFDCSLLAGSSPIILRIDLARGAREVCGVAVGQPLTILDDLVNGPKITEATVLFTTVELADQSQSLAAVLRSNPELVSSYNFVHYQEFTAQSISAEPSEVDGKAGYGGPNTQKHSLNLTSFIRSDLLSITFSLIETVDDYASIRGSDHRCAGRFNPIQPLDFEIQYNGQRMFYSPGEGSFARILSLRGRPGAGYYEGTDTFSVATGVVAAEPVYYYPLVYESGFMGAMGSCNQWELSNTSRFPNQVITCSFRTPFVAAAARDGSYKPTYRLVCTYAYQALAEVNSQGGVSIIFS